LNASDIILTLSTPYVWSGLWPNKKKTRSSVSGRLKTLTGCSRDYTPTDLYRPTCSGGPEAKDKDNEYYHQVEIEYGEFRRVLDLPRPVDADRATARYDDGLLYIVLPKTEVEVTIHTIIEIL
jgi:hypothetical protein